VTTIGGGTFNNCRKLVSVNIPDGLSAIADGVFECCVSLASITIPSSVTSIGRWAFVCCQSLTTVEIPSSVTKIGFRAFEACRGLTSVIVRPVTPPAGDDRIFESTTCLICVPSESVEAYKAAKYWSAYSDRIVEI
jgi:hypothetical protein